MPTIGTEDFTDRPLVTVGRDFKTSNEYQLKADESCVFGEVLKRDGDYLTPVTATADIAFTIAYQSVDAVAGVPQDINYLQSGTVIESKVVCGADNGVGTIADFKDSLQDYGISTKKEK